MEFTIDQIALMLGGEVKGNGSETVNMLAKIQEAKKGQITFLSNPKYEQYIYTTKASAVIVNRDFVPKKTAGIKPYSCGRCLHKLYIFAGGIPQADELSEDRR